MSWWTYINGTIEVDIPGYTQEHREYILKTVLNHLPRVTGSEKDMEIYINQREGYDHSVCGNEFGEFSNLLKDYCGRRGVYGSLNTQSHYLITVCGSLRDRMFKQTFKEFQNWLCRLAKRIGVRNVIVSINCPYDKSYVIKDISNKYWRMWEDFSWQDNSNGEPAWIEYLFWDKGIDSEFPMLLEYKYNWNPKNDKEVERRRKESESGDD